MYINRQTQNEKTILQPDSPTLRSQGTTVQLGAKRRGRLSSSDTRWNEDGSHHREAGQSSENALSLSADHLGERVNEILNVAHCKAWTG